MEQLFLFTVADVWTWMNSHLESCIFKAFVLKVSCYVRSSAALCHMLNWNICFSFLPWGHFKNGIWTCFSFWEATHLSSLSMCIHFLVHSNSLDFFPVLILLQTSKPSFLFSSHLDETSHLLQLFSYSLNKSHLLLTLYLPPSPNYKSQRACSRQVLYHAATILSL